MHQRRSAADVALELELGRGAQSVARRVNDGPQRAVRLPGEDDRARRQGGVALADAEEAADADHDGGDLPAAADDQVLDLAEALVLQVAHLGAETLAI
jgi:hypothetical protein